MSLVEERLDDVVEALTARVEGGEVGIALVADELREPLPVQGDVEAHHWDMAIVVPPRGTRGSEIPSFARALMRVMQGPYHLAFRQFGDRMRVQGRSLIELETVGAKSGSPRHAVVGSFPEIAAAVPSSWVVVASNAGSARHPAWFLNLARNPDQVWITTGKRRIKVMPETLEGVERDRAWQEITSLAPGYGRYIEVTDRAIPIVRLRQF